MLNQETLVPISFIIIVILAVRWLDSRFKRIEFALKTNMQNRWTSVDQRLWALELSNLNKDLKIPAYVPPQAEEFKLE